MTTFIPREALAQRKLTERERELLALFEVGPDNTARFTSNEIIPDWKVVKAVFEALGAQWKTGKPKGGFVFPSDADSEEILAAAVESGEILDAKLVGFFETPSVLASKLVAIALDKFPLRARDSIRALEPSAGKGRIVKAMIDAGIVHIRAVELLGENGSALIRNRDTHVFAGDVAIMIADFLGMTPPKTADRVDIVVMNPPFKGQAAIDHILHAFKFLAPKGRLVSVADAGVKFRENEKAEAFRKFIREHHGAIIDLKPNSFRESGTDVNTVTVIVDAP